MPKNSKSSTDMPVQSAATESCMKEFMSEKSENCTC